MKFDRRKLLANICKKGFRSESNLPPHIKHVKRGRQDHLVHHLLLGEGEDAVLTRVSTFTSHTKKMKTLGDDLFRKMARQVGLTSGQFADLANCPLSQSAYLAILVQSGTLDRELVVGHHPEVAELLEDS